MKRLVSIALALSLLAPAAALAQGAPPGQPGGPPPMQPRPENRGPERGPPPHAAPAPSRRATMTRHRGEWKRGERFEGHRYVLDWRRHHVRQPPRGYQWVHEGNQYLMIAIGSGVIAEIVVPRRR